MMPPKLIGITGTIGSGKSTVGETLARRGFPVIDTDHVVHTLLASDPSVQRSVVDRFGTSIVCDNGAIDRIKLGALVFNDDEARHDLEAILHPAVLEQCNKIAASHASDRAVFFLVPLLFEAKLQNRYTEIWTVIAEEGVLLERLKARTNQPEDELRKRIHAQLPQDVKVKGAHRVIDNSHGLANTEKQVDAILKESGLT